MTKSDFKPEVEKWQVRACMIKNYAVHSLLIDNWPKFPHPVAFLLTTNCNLYANLAMGKIPCSTECISSLQMSLLRMFLT